MKNLEDVLRHYGVMGMKWGVRQNRRSRSQSSKETSALRKKRAYELTDEELKKVNNRLNLEKQFRQLNPTTAQKGQDVTGKILGNAGKAVLTAGATVAITAVGKAVYSAATSAVAKTVTESVMKRSG